MKTAIVIVVLPLALSTVAFAVAFADFGTEKQSNWHHWRGPEINGVSRTANPPTTWSEQENVKWKVAVDGKGTSTPIVWGDRVFLLTAIDTKQVDPTLSKPEDQAERPFGITYPNTTYEFVVICLDRHTGKEIWRRTAADKIPHQGHHGDNSFASASPTTDGKRLYAWFGSVGIFCYDLNGDLLWKRDLGTVETRLSFGEGSSPVVHGNRVVINRDNESDSKITVLDAGTGDFVWQEQRDEPSAWATPLIVEHGGRTQIITNASNRVRSYDLVDGELNWECGGQMGNVTPSPVRFDNVVICMSGYKGYSALALPLDSQGDITESEKIAWSKNRATPYVPSPLLYDDLLYFNQSNDAILSCLNARTGEAEISPTRIPKIRGIYASPVGANDRVYVTGRDGATVVLRHGNRFEVLAENQLADGFDASPALVDNQLLLRGRSYLYCISEE